MMFMNDRGNYRAGRYLLKNYKAWYTYAYLAYRTGALSVSPEVGNIFEAHGMSGRTDVDRHTRSKLRKCGLNLVMVRGITCAPTWVTATTHGKGEFELEVHVPRAVGRPTSLRRQSSRSRNRKPQLVVRVEKKGNVNVKVHVGPKPIFAENTEKTTIMRRAEPDGPSQKVNVEVVDAYPMISTEPLYLEVTFLEWRFPWTDRWGVRGVCLPFYGHRVTFPVNLEKT